MKLDIKKDTGKNGISFIYGFTDASFDLNIKTENTVLMTIPVSGALFSGIIGFLNSENLSKAEEIEGFNFKGMLAYRMRDFFVCRKNFDSEAFFNDEKLAENIFLYCDDFDDDVAYSESSLDDWRESLRELMKKEKDNAVKFIKAIKSECENQIYKNTERYEKLSEDRVSNVFFDKDNKKINIGGLFDIKTSELKDVKETIDSFFKNYENLIEKNIKFNKEGYNKMADFYEKLNNLVSENQYGEDDMIDLIQKFRETFKIGY